MSTAEGGESAEAGREQSTRDRRDATDYRALGSLYLALLVGPLVATLAQGPGVTVTSWLLTGVGCLVGGTVGFVAASRVAVGKWLTRVWTAVPLSVAPLGYVVWAFALFANNPGKTAATLLLRPNTVGIVATVPFAVALAQAARESTTHHVETSTVHVEFEARRAPRARRIQNWSMAAGLGALAGLTLVLFVRDLLDPWTLLVVGVAAAGFGVLFARENSRTVVLTADGVAVDESFIGWADIGGYEITDDALVLTRKSALFGDLAFDIGDVSSLDEVKEALDQHIDETG